MNSSYSDDDSGWNDELIAAVSKKQGKTRTISEEDRIRQIKDCICEEADINAVDRNGNTALHVAVKRSYKRIVEFLLETGARTDISNRKGDTAIALAENFGIPDILNVFNRPSTSRTSALLIDKSLPNSPLEMSGRKRPADAGVGSLDKRHRKLRSIDVSQSDLRHSDVADEETYKASGLKKSLHGVAYQWKHLMLVLYRAWKMDSLDSFRLATEMDAAESFDDIVLRYTESNGDVVERFVQVKHKQNKNEAISASHLLNVEGGRFSLLKYFTSWRRIKKDPYFKVSKSKHFILCTNIDLAVDDLNRENINVSEVTEPDNFLSIENSTEQPPRYKLRVENPSSLWNTLKLASDGHRLAKELADRVSDVKKIELRSDVMISYHFALAKEVLNTDKKNFFVNFIENNGLSEEAAQFRKILFCILRVEGQSEQDVCERLREKKFQFSIPFGKDPPSQYTKLSVDEVNDEEIRCFFGEFILAVNQPNEEELGKMIELEIATHGQFNLVDAGFVGRSFQFQILNWFKEKGGTFLRKENVDGIFNEIKVELGSLKIMALSFECSEKLKGLGIQFKGENTELRDFINRRNDTSKQLLEIITPNQTLLTALQVYQTLEQAQKLKIINQDVVFIRLKTLSIPNIMKLVLGTFQLPRHHNLLVVDCGSSNAKQHSLTLWNRLCDIMDENIDKRMIVITQTGNYSDTQIEFTPQRDEVKNIDHSFSNLTKDSQKKLLEKKVIKFQGQNDKTCFGKLLGICYDNNLGVDELKDLSEIMDPDVLHKLITQDEIKIGNDLESSNEIVHYYINRTICRHDKKTVIEDEKIPHSLTEKTSLMKRSLTTDLFTDCSGIDNLSDEVTPSEETSPPAQSPTDPTILDSAQEKKQFDVRCVKNENLESIENSMRDFTDDQLTNHDKLVIISDTAGTGKSTTLTYLAGKLKETNPDMLVLKIILNDCSTALKEVRKEDLGSINEALQFLVTKLLISSETGLARKVFKRMIKMKYKVAIIFDGFDEICPKHENTVIVLLQILAQHGIQKLFVATRPHTRQVLESKLRTSSYQIRPLSADSQEDFFTKFWKTKLGSCHNSKQKTEERIRKYAKGIMKKLADSLEDRRNEFTDVPLQARLVAEIFENSCKEFTDSDVEQPNFSEKMNLINLYERIIKMTFDIFFGSIGSNTANEAMEKFKKLAYDKFIKTHEKLALGAVFHKESVEQFLHSRLDVKLTSPEGTNHDPFVNQPGIITKFIDSRPHFRHRTYAEYFAARFFWKMLEDGDPNPLVKEIFVTDVLPGNNSISMRAFMNSQLLDDEYVDVLDGESWTFHLTKYQNKRLGETLSYLAAAAANGRIIGLFLNCSMKLLHRAAVIGKSELAKYLQDMRASVNVQMMNDSMPLQEAAVQNGNLNLVNCLLVKGAHDTQHINGSSPLHTGAYDDELDVIKWPTLHAAAYKGKINLVKDLFKDGANINSTMDDGQTPLHSAARGGRLDVIEYLLRNGANINSTMDDGSTPLQLAVQLGKVYVVNYLLNRRANINT